jgi:cellulose synthase/poly-beta-1,6-N-acetylglucosamine synthase-like glycosyltransferase
VIPAHNEESVIGKTLASIEAADYPPNRLQTFVIADNCDDGTARVAAAAGATVLERASERKGKGHALGWAMRRILDDHPDFEAIVVVDADCQISPNLPTVMAGRFTRGAQAVQANYVVANPDASPTSALRSAGFSLMNTVRPQGKDRLGLSSGLFGTGMGFTRECLTVHPWDAYSLLEDAEYHVGLVGKGIRVEFAPEASVSSPMPTSRANAKSQGERWESGKLRLIAGPVRALIRGGLRDRDVVQLNAAIEHLVPPQGLLIAANVVSVGGAAVLRSRSALLIAWINIAAQVAFVVGGLLIVRAPWSVFRALLFAPGLIAQKLLLYGRLALGKHPREWVRTERELPASVPWLRPANGPR